jgi:hypothetical protein
MRFLEGKENNLHITKSCRDSRTFSSALLACCVRLYPVWRQSAELRLCRSHNDSLFHDRRERNHNCMHTQESRNPWKMQTPWFTCVARALLHLCSFENERLNRFCMKVVSKDYPVALNKSYTEEPRTENHRILKRAARFLIAAVLRLATRR